MKKTLIAIFSAALVLTYWVINPKCEEWQKSLVISSDGSKISVHADNVPLQQILSKLAVGSDLNIYLAPSLSKVPVTEFFDDLPFEKAVQRLLKDFNFLASFKKEQGVERLAVLKIYPKGTSKGYLIPIESQIVEVGTILEEKNPVNDVNGLKVNPTRH